jgi:hypothetical protein
MMLIGCAMIPVHEIYKGREPEPLQGVLKYVMQVALYETRQEASKASLAVKEIENSSVNIIYQPPFYRVMAGSFMDRGEADIMVECFRTHGFPNARWVYDTTKK